MERLLEARLTEEFAASAKRYGVIHSKFQNVINVLFGIPLENSRLITVITPGTKGIPDSITVSEEFYGRLERLPVGAKVLYSNLSFCFDSLSDVLTGDIRSLKKSELIIETTAVKPGLKQLIHSAEEFEIYSKNSFFGEMSSALPSERRLAGISGLKLFSDSWLKLDRVNLERVLSEYAGLGVGLTPSCDDAFLGIIAIYSGIRLYALRLGHRLADELGLGALRRLPDISTMTPFNRLLVNRTTDVSLKYLCCSQEGRYSDAVLELVRAVISGTENDVKRCTQAVASIGGSSGTDTLFGMETALRELNKLL